MGDASGDLGRILGVWGHPDDEAWLSSGLMMRAIESGHRVACVTATRGEAGFPADDTRSAAERMAVRERELAACLGVLGVTEHRYLGYADGGCADLDDTGPVATLAAVVDAFAPDTVLTFGPDGATGHPDHISVCRWTTAAIDVAGHRGARLLYASKTPEWLASFRAALHTADVMMVDDLEPEVLPESEMAVSFSCDDRLLARKLEAMRAQASQIEPLIELSGLGPFTELLRQESFRDPRPGDAAVLERMSAIRL